MPLSLPQSQETMRRMCVRDCRKLLIAAQERIKVLEEVVKAYCKSEEDIRRTEEHLGAGIRDLLDREALVKQRFEQQEAVLKEAAEKGIELASAVLEQCLIPENTYHADRTE